jgi:hypothetical protein
MSLKRTSPFSDSPDFQGVMQHADGSQQKFIGDIGQVSPIGMREGIAVLEPFSLWISVIDEYTQIIIEPLAHFKNYTG